MKIMIPIKYMAKNLASKLRTGLAIGAGLIALAGTPKADAGLIYDSGLQTLTNNVPTGSLKLSYQQIIEDADTNGDGIFDSYISRTFVKNKTFDVSTQDSSFYIMNINADLAGRGATGLTNYWASEGNIWNYEQNGENISRMILNESSIALEPGFSDTFFYTIKKDLNADGIDDVLGFENVGASMQANADSVNFAFQAPIAIPEPMTMGLFALGGAAALVGRKAKEYYRQI
jgi:hypothetical protein